MRGFKRDEHSTRLIRFLDSRSFLSLPKAIKGECDIPDAHFILHGKDKANQRILLFERDRECGICRHEFVDENEGEWDHIRTTAGERCDCLANGRRVHVHCHQKRHAVRSPRFGMQEAQRA